MRRPVVTRFSTARPFSTTRTFSIPANVTSASAGTVTSLRSGWTTISPRAKAPGRSRPCSLGISASIISERFCSLIAGASRATWPSYTVGSLSRVRRTRWPWRIVAASRSGTASRSRSGLMRTSVATGAPAFRNSPTWAWRAFMAPSIGARSTVSASCCRASSSSVRFSARTPRRLFTSSTAS